MPGLYINYPHLSGNRVSRVIDSGDVTNFTSKLTSCAHQALSIKSIVFFVLLRIGPYDMDRNKEERNLEK